MLHLQDDRADAVEQDGEDEIIEEKREFDLPVGHGRGGVKMGKKWGGRSRWKVVRILGFEVENFGTPA